MVFEVIVDEGVAWPGDGAVEVPEAVEAEVPVVADATVAVAVETEAVVAWAILVTVTLFVSVRDGLEAMVLTVKALLEEGLVEVTCHVALPVAAIVPRS